MSSKPEKVIRFCPRCQNPYSYIEKRKKNGHVYCYSVHETRIDGKRHVHKCYLGAEEYTYVKMMHPEMLEKLSGMHDNERYIRYLEDIIKLLEQRITEEGQANRVKNILREGVEKFSQLSNQVENTLEIEQGL